MLLQPIPCGPVDRYFCTAGFYMVFSFHLAEYFKCQDQSNRSKLKLSKPVCCEISKLRVDNTLPLAYD